jgi:hypothetical protein
MVHLIAAIADHQHIFVVIFAASLAGHFSVIVID